MDTLASGNVNLLRRKGNMNSHHLVIKLHMHMHKHMHMHMHKHKHAHINMQTQVQAHANTYRNNSVAPCIETLVSLQEHVHYFLYGHSCH